MCEKLQLSAKNVVIDAWKALKIYKKHFLHILDN